MGDTARFTPGTINLYYILAIKQSHGLAYTPHGWRFCGAIDMHGGPVRKISVMPTLHLEVSRPSPVPRHNLEFLASASKLQTFQSNQLQTTLWNSSSNSSPIFSSGVSPGLCPLQCYRMVILAFGRPASHPGVCIHGEKVQGLSWKASARGKQ